LLQSQFKLLAPRRPFCRQLLGCFAVEGDAGCGDLVADRGNAMLERERFRWLTVGLEKLTYLLVQACIADAAFL
jgi:hypothetical protein